MADNTRPRLDHTVVRATDPTVSARFLTDLLGLDVGRRSGLFVSVRTGNGVTLDFLATDDATTGHQHLAFAVTEQQFDDTFARLVARNVTYCADPFARQPGRINHAHGGRGLYVHDPDGINLEIQTIADGAHDA